MAFDTGRVTFCRYRVVQQPEKIDDQAVLDALNEHAFEPTEIGTPPEVEAGLVSVEHVLDRRFSYEKNIFGSVILMGLRIDTNRPPADLRRAYRRQHEQAAGAANPSGFPTKAQRKEAIELAERQLAEETASGRFRRSRLVPLLWDRSRKQILLGTLGASAGDQLGDAVHQALGLRVEPLTAGVVAGESLRQRGRTRDYEDLRPWGFTAPPTHAGQAADEDGAARPERQDAAPPVPWSTTGVDTKDFLGNEMLLWMWNQVETAEGLIPLTAGSEAAITIDRQLDLHCAWGVTGQCSLKGDAPTRLPEAADALRVGKWPRRIGLILAEGGDQWELTLIGETLAVGSAALPPIEKVDSPRELVEARLVAIERLADLIDRMLLTYLERRISDEGEALRRRMRGWIRGRGPAV